MVLSSPGIISLSIDLPTQAAAVVVETKRFASALRVE
jgi:hypothetical protein